MALTITSAQLQIVQQYALAGNYAEGWKQLASFGDTYADNAYAVTTGLGDRFTDPAFAILVQKHWENTAGADAYATKFGKSWSVPDCFCSENISVE